MKMNGTSFQKLVWRELLSIPLGETRTYKQIADAIGKPSSSRAVANACAANPYAPFVPCHRVIRSDGSWWLLWPRRDRGKTPNARRRGVQALRNK